MGDFIRVQGTIEGVDKLIIELGKLGANVQKSIVGSVRAGARTIQQAAEANARSITAGHTGRRKHVALRVRMRKGVGANGSYAVASVYPAKGFAELRPIETGTRSGWRWARRKGPFVFFAGNRQIVTRLIKHPGTAARPWLRPAFDSRKNDAVKAIGDALRDAVERARVVAEGSDDD